MKTRAIRIGLLIAALHAALFAVTATYEYTSSAGQAALVWVFWAVVDFPISLLYFIAPWYTALIEKFVADDSFFAQVLYMPHLIHGLFGTVWWYFLPRLFMPKRSGGIWGKTLSANDSR